MLEQKCSDYIMREYASRVMLDAIKNKKEAPKEILDNFVTSLTACYLKQIPYGEDTDLLYHDLYALYAYQDIDKKEKDFSAGAVYGAIQFYKKFLELKK